MNRLRICRLPFLTTIVALGIGLGACSTGRMIALETYYLAVPGDNNTNYFRIRVEAEAKFTKAEYDAGWYPASTVDQLYGGTAKEDVAEVYKLRDEIRDSYDKAIKSTLKGYLDAAKNPNSSAEDIQRWLAASRRVRAYAGDGVQLPDGALELEYNPAASLAERHAGEKLVLVLSSDPTQVLEKIGNFAKSAETGASVLRLADVIKQQAANEVIEQEAINEAKKPLDGAVLEQLSSVLERLEAQGDMDRDQLQQEVTTLLVMVESLQ